LSTKFKYVSLHHETTTELFDNMDENGEVPFSFISEKIVAEFGEVALDEAKKQYDFMFQW
jgi:hypothetical protein